MVGVLGYARVSTADQDPEVQRRRLRDEAGAIRIFEDVVFGKTFDRPGLTKLLDFARPDDVICVVRLDRLGRLLKELLETVDGFKVRWLEFRSLEERLDTASAAGALVFHVFGAIAHFERRLIVERPKDGINAVIARGKKPGRPVLNADKLFSALKLIEAGVRPTQAAKQLGLGRSTLYRKIAAAKPEATSRSGEHDHTPGTTARTSSSKTDSGVESLIVARSMQSS